MASMKREPELNNSAKTEPGNQPEPVRSEVDLSDLDEGTVTPIGVGVTSGEKKALDEIANVHQVTRHALIKVAIRELIKAERMGTIDIDGFFDEPEKPRKRLKKSKR